MSTKERIRIIQILEKIEKDPLYAETLGITVTVPKQSEKPFEICTV